MINFFKKIFTKDSKEIYITDLPTQGYFYDRGLRITISKGSDKDREFFNKSLSNSNIFGIISTIITILRKYIKFNLKGFRFNALRAVDVFYLFVEFVKFTKEDDVIFKEVEFDKHNFIHFDFVSFLDNYDHQTREFVFDGWRFSMPSIGVETSLNHFSHELSIRGEIEKYQDANFNLIYFLGNRIELRYEEMINLIESLKDLDKKEIEKVNNIVNEFTSLGVYVLKGDNGIVKISPEMLKTIW